MKLCFNSKAFLNRMVAKLGIKKPMYDKDKLLEELVRDEGLDSNPYRDSLGIWTVGIGHNLEEHGLPMGMLVDVISRAGGLNEGEINLLTNKHIAEAGGHLDSIFPAWRAMSDTRQRVLMNMIFNLGPTRLQGFRLMFGALARKDYEEAAVQMMDSKWAEQVGERSTRLRTMMLEG